MVAHLFKLRNSFWNQIKKDTRLHTHCFLPHAVRLCMFPALHTSDNKHKANSRLLWRHSGARDAAVSLNADVLLPLVEVGSQWPGGAAVLKSGWRRDLSSKRCGPVSSLEKRWCCSHSHTSTCSLGAGLFLEVRWCERKWKLQNCNLFQVVSEFP